MAASYRLTSVRPPPRMFIEQSNITMLSAEQSCSYAVRFRSKRGNKHSLYSRETVLYFLENGIRCCWIFGPTVENFRAQSFVTHDSHISRERVHFPARLKSGNSKYQSTVFGVDHLMVLKCAI